MKKILIFSMLLLSKSLISSEHDAISIGQNSSDDEVLIDIPVEEKSSPTLEQQAIFYITQPKMSFMHRSATDEYAASVSLPQLNNADNEILNNLVVFQADLKEAMQKLVKCEQIKENLEMRISQLENPERVKTLEQQVLILKSEIEKLEKKINHKSQIFEKLKKKFSKCCAPVCLKLSKLFSCCTKLTLGIDKQAADQE